MRNRYSYASIRKMIQLRQCALQDLTKIQERSEREALYAEIGSYENRLLNSEWYAAYRESHPNYVLFSTIPE